MPIYFFSDGQRPARNNNIFFIHPFIHLFQSNFYSKRGLSSIEL